MLASYARKEVPNSYEYHSWGRKETIVSPPQVPVYSYAAITLPLLLTWPISAHLISFSHDAARTVLPLAVSSHGAVAAFRQAGAIPASHLGVGQPPPCAACCRCRRGARVTVMEFARPLPLQLTMSARAAGLVYLYRGPKTASEIARSMPTCTVRLSRPHRSRSLPLAALIAGLGVLLILLPFAARKDVERFREMKYGRLLKGPVRVTPRSSTGPSKVTAWASKPSNRSSSCAFHGSPKGSTSS